MRQGRACPVEQSGTAKQIGPRRHHCEFVNGNSYRPLPGCAPANRALTLGLKTRSDGSQVHPGRHHFLNGTTFSNEPSSLELFARVALCLAAKAQCDASLFWAVDKLSREHLDCSAARLWVAHRERLTLQQIRQVQTSAYAATDVNKWLVEAYARTEQLGHAGPGQVRLSQQLGRSPQIHFEVHHSWASGKGFQQETALDQRGPDRNLFARGQACGLCPLRCAHEEPTFALRLNLRQVF